MTTKSCPKCGGTMALIHPPYLHEDYWFCVTCWNMITHAVQWRVWTSDNTGDRPKEDEE